MTMITENSHTLAPTEGRWKTVIVRAWKRFLKHKSARELSHLALGGEHLRRGIGVKPEDLRAGRRLPSARDAATDLEILSLRR